jgi:hypothetical protein
MMSNKKILIWLIPALLILLFLSFITGYFIKNFDYFKCDFFKVKATDVFQISVALFVAYYVTIFVNHRTSSDSRRKDIVMDLINKYQSVIDDIYKLGNAYMNNPTEKNHFEILGHFRDAGNLLALIEKITKECNVNEMKKLNIKDLRDKHLNLKRELTNGPFGKDYHQYDSGTIIAFNSQYTEILFDNYELKFKICY